MEMIKSETIKINETQYKKTYSDAGYYITRNGIKYTEAIDPVDAGREYKELEEKMPEEDFKIITEEVYE